jgi:long-chain acyl-CoA synthetase
MLNLAFLLDDSAREVPERTVIVCERTRLSYAQLNAAANQVANGLIQAGIQRGDKIALSCQNVPSFVIAYYGILKAGAVVLPMNTLLKPRRPSQAQQH